MRLLTVGSLPPEWGGQVRGGVATFHASLLTGLLERRDEVEIAGVFPPVGVDGSAPFPVPFFFRPGDTPRAAFYEMLLERLEPDVVLINHVAHTVGATHARLEGAPPALGVVHSWHSVTLSAREERSRAIAVNEEALGGMSGVALPSRHTLAEGERLGFRYPPIVATVPYPLPPLYMDDDLDVSGGERRGVLFLGSLTRRKGPLALARAAAQLPGTEVMYVGEGELEPDLRRLVEHLRLGDRVVVAGALPGADHLRRVRELLLASNLLCLPSQSESFGIVFIEALACGTPVVGFGPTVREIRRAMGVEVGEPLERGTPEEIAAAIERVESTTWDRERLRRAAVNAFGLSRTTDRYLELLRRTAGSSTESPRDE